MTTDDVWRPIPNFPNYMMNVEGEVRNHRTGKLLYPGYDQNHRMFWVLHRGGKRYKRGYQRLYNSVFPPRREAEVFSDWEKIPGFESYEINRFGQVRRVSTKRLLKPGGKSGSYVQLSKDSVTYRRGISGLMRLVGHPWPVRE